MPTSRPIQSAAAFASLVSLGALAAGASACSGSTSVTDTSDAADASQDASADDDSGVGLDVVGFDGDPTIDVNTCAGAAKAKSYIGCDYWPTVVANQVWSIFDFAVVVANAGTTDADAVLFREMDNLPFEQLPSFARLMSRVTEPAARARLLPELTRRESGTDAPVAIAAAAIHLAWAPETAVFRMLAALSSPSRQDRDLAERYLVKNDTAVVTELLRRALAREGSESTRNQLRRILDLRADRNRTP